MVTQAMAAVGVGPEATVMIGDTTFDLDMARAAGVAAVAVSWGYHPLSELARRSPEAMVHDGRDLLPALEALWSRRAGNARGPS
jgi:phosphoglycolate phosphatase